MHRSRRFVGYACLVCLALLACKKGKPEGGGDAGLDAGGTDLTRGSAFCSAQCKQSGKCYEKIERTLETIGGRTEIKKSSSCVAGQDSDCKAADDCRIHGSCTLDVAECRPKDDSDCQKSENCKARGNCSKDVVCAVRSAKDCSGDVCTKNGLCKFLSLSPTYGRCEPASSADCKKSARCAAEGACAAMKGGSLGYTVCGAASDADCKASAVCKNEQRCRQGKALDDFGCVR
jgi:hypothetical protein